MNTIRNMILGAALLPMLPAAAQQQAKDSTLNRTVVVENQYNPEVMDAFKVNVLPQIEEPAVAKQHIDYAESQRPLTTWAVAPMGPITRSLTQPVAPRGYIRGAYGNRNNTDFKASYLWNISSRDQLGVMASLYGLCGDIPMLTEEDDWKSRFFRTDFLSIIGTISSGWLFGWEVILLHRYLITCRLPLRLPNFPVIWTNSIIPWPKDMSVFGLQTHLSRSVSAFRPGCAASAESMPRWVYGRALKIFSIQRGIWKGISPMNSRWV